MDFFKEFTVSFIINIELLLVSYFVLLRFAACEQCKREGNHLQCTTIPKDIPDGIDSVYLKDEGHLQPLHRGIFSGRNWNNVSVLKLFRTPDTQTENYVKEIEPYAMEGLVKLNQLFITSDKLIDLHNQSFAGLDSLKRLNFTGCPKINFQNIVKAIRGPEVLPCLEVFSVTYTSVVSGIVLGKDFFNAIATKPIKCLDFHKIDITSVKVRYLTGIQDTLQFVNFSGTTLDKLKLKGIRETRLVKKPKVLDVSYVNMPKWMLWFIIHLPSLLNHSLNLNMTDCTLISNFETIDFSGIISNAQDIRLQNMTIKLINSKQGPIKWKTKFLHARHNNLKYLDVTVPCNRSSIQKLDLSYNNMEFIRPDLCPCCFNLQDLDLSNNKLYLMANRNFSIFTQLVKYFQNLTSINMAANNLTIIPESIFVSSVNLETIDLSINKLQGVHIRLQNLVNLKRLKLQNNRIKILDDTSLANLQSLINHSYRQKKISEIVDLRHNPISCASCNTVRSIDWLVNVLKCEKLECTNNEGSRIPLDESALTYVQDICDKPIRVRNTILISTLIPAVSIAILVSISCWFMKYRRRLLYKRNMEEKVRLIQENEMDTEYIVFLCYSNDDYRFVKNSVYETLQHHLRRMTGTERELICLGDRNFQLGKSINDEIIRSLANSAVVLLIVSNRFCESEYCRMEFDHALLMRKPIVLMMKEEVSEDRMVPSLREIFRNRTRILWERDGDVYQLKTTWENVCTSILELVQD